MTITEEILAEHSVVWIVEAVPPEGGAKFLCAGAQWTSDAWAALHFARKQDADEVADHLSDKLYPGKGWYLRSASHSWNVEIVRDSPPTTSPTPGNELLEAAKEAVEDLAERIKHEYAGTTQYPSQARRFERDFKIVDRLRLAISNHEGKEP